MDWTPHGTSGRKDEELGLRPGWWLPLAGTKWLDPPLPLAEIRAEGTWLKGWMARARRNGPAKLPFNEQAGDIRGAQGYLSRMPSEWVERFSKLRSVVDTLSDLNADNFRPSPIAHGANTFNPKSNADYVALIRGGKQRRSRSHETLVRTVGEWLRERGQVVSTPHPIDLLVESPIRVIIEAKTCRNREPLHAIREAVGQLREYQYFVGSRGALLCVLLDAEPSQDLVQYAEGHLGIGVMWRVNAKIGGGDLAASNLGVALTKIAAD